ncbi:MAG: Fis family transcriptional regulator [Crocosphaera sp.]
MKDTVNNPHNGSSFDDFLKEESLYEECSLIAIKRVLARQVMEKRKQFSLTKIEIAEQMQTSQEKLEIITLP